MSADIQYHNINVLSSYKAGEGDFYLFDSGDLKLHAKSDVLWSELPIRNADSKQIVLSRTELLEYNRLYVEKYMQWYSNYRTVDFNTLL